jgi:inward rectifier potassium channel
MSIEEDGKMVNKFYSLDLELENKCVILKLDPSSHPITEESPLFKFTKDDFANTQVKFLFCKTFDDMFSNTVAIRTSYTFEEVI